MTQLVTSINVNYRPDGPVDEILLNRTENGVVTLTLNRPRVKNAIPPTMWEQLRRIFAEVNDTDSDRVLVVTGAGGAFCAGADLSRDLASRSRQHPLLSMRPVNAAALARH